MVGRMGAHDTHTWEAGWAGMMGNMADGMGGHGMHTWEIGMGGHDTHIWLDKMGGGIFAKTAKTPPLQSGIAGMPLRAIANDQHSPPLPRRKGSAPFIPGRGNRPAAFVATWRAASRPQKPHRTPKTQR
ncbi:MAG: hypothetical protein ACFNYD_03805, partial [Bacteroides sp.]